MVRTASWHSCLSRPSLAGKGIIAAILHTDMMKHNEMIKAGLACLVRGWVSLVCVANCISTRDSGRILHALLQGQGNGSGFPRRS